MFQPGDLVVHGATGVCLVEAILRPAFPGADRSKDYYQLKPLRQTGVIYSPVDNPKVHLRPVISRAEADALIDSIPTLRVEVCSTSSLQALTQHYQTELRSGDCRRLMELAMSIYCKRKELLAKNRRPGVVDERFFQRAEQLLFDELSAALDIPCEEVSTYIAGRMEAASAT